ncbi:MAG: DUF177 domain-containing protein [Actinomycetota bacterium]|nr:DUF177 domain-containing protein [Actinomycetota bacterium]
MVRPSHIYHLNTHEVPRRAGEMKEYQLDLLVPESVGVPLIAVPLGDVIEVDARLEAVAEGILLSAEIFAIAKGECIRCLDPVEVEIDRKIQELYLYEEDAPKKGSRIKRDQPVDVDDVEVEDILYLDGVIMDLDHIYLHFLVLELPVNPLCDPECLGLCPDCGQKWEVLPQDHAHEVIDARWSGLAGLDFKNLDS